MPHQERRDHKKEKPSRNELILLGLLLLFSVIIISWMSSVDNVLLWDEAVYLSNARSHVGTSYYTEDFRFPLVEWTLAALWSITGESLFLAKILYTLFSLLSIGLFYVIARRYTKQYALLATALYVFTYEVLFWSFRIYTEPLGMLFMLSSWYMLVRERPLVLLAGMFSGLSFLARFPFALFGLAVGLHLVFTKQYKSAAYFSVGVLIVLSPWMIYNQIHYDDPLWDLNAQYRAVDQYTTEQSVSSLILAFVWNLHILIPFLLIGAYIISKQMHTQGYLLLYLLFNLLYYTLIVKYKLSRYLLALIPFFILLAALGLQYVLQHIKTKRQKTVWVSHLFIFVLLLFSIAALSYQLVEFREDSACREVLAPAISYVLEHTEPSDTILSNAWIWYAYHGNLNTRSIWSSDIAYLVRFYQAKLVVIHEIGGAEGYASAVAQTPALHLEQHINGACYDILIYAPKYLTSEYSPAPDQLA